MTVVLDLETTAIVSVLKGAARWLWCHREEASGIRQMQTLARTLRQRRRGLLNWYDHPLSTGPLEVINNKIGASQRRAYGYRNDEHLKERLLTLHDTKFARQG